MHRVEFHVLRAWRAARWLAAILLAALAAAADLGACVGAHGTRSSGADIPFAGDAASVTVWLFLGCPRCPAGKRTERMVREAVARLPSVEVRTVDLGDPTNRHFILDFGIQADTVVLQADGRSTVLGECLQPGGDEGAMVACLAGRIADSSAGAIRVGGGGGRAECRSDRASPFGNGLAARNTEGEEEGGTEGIWRWSLPEGEPCPKDDPTSFPVAMTGTARTEPGPSGGSKRGDASAVRAYRCGGLSRMLAR